ncbi:MAG TPA: FixH family protein [Kofleriaceae bacterium]
MRRLGMIVVACLGHGCTNKQGTPNTGACEKTGRGDPFAAGLTKHGAGGRFDFKLISAAPAPPARGDNKWVVEVDAASGGAVPHADVAATPFMPDHGHGTPMKVGVTPLATPGQYELAPLNLWMPGYWEISVTATSSNDHDSAVFKLCIAK